MQVVIVDSLLLNVKRWLLQFLVFWGSTLIKTSYLIWVLDWVTARGMVFYIRIALMGNSHVVPKVYALHNAYNPDTKKEKLKRKILPLKKIN